MPYYPIDADTFKRIVALKDTCNYIELDNISFEYTDATFTISKYRTFWELVVRSGGYADIYRIKGGEIKFVRSEVD